MSEGNGHEPVVTDLGAILEATRPTRVLRIPLAALREDSLTPFELVAVGRALQLTPAELTREVANRGGWTAVELAQAFAWAIVRRVEPALTWEEAQHFALDIVGVAPDPPKRGGRQPSRSPGTSGA